MAYMSSPQSIGFSIKSNRFTSAWLAHISQHRCTAPRRSLHQSTNQSASLPDVRANHGVLYLCVYEDTHAYAPRGLSFLVCPHFPLSLSAETPSWAPSNLASEVDLEVVEWYHTCVCVGMKACVCVCLEQWLHWRHSKYCVSGGAGCWFWMPTPAYRIYECEKVDFFALCSKCE